MVVGDADELDETSPILTAATTKSSQAVFAPGRKRDPLASVTPMDNLSFSLMPGRSIILSESTKDYDSVSVSEPLSQGQQRREGCRHLLVERLGGLQIFGGPLMQVNLHDPPASEVTTKRMVETVPRSRSVGVAHNRAGIAKSPCCSLVFLLSAATRHLWHLYPGG